MYYVSKLQNLFTITTLLKDLKLFNLGLYNISFVASTMPQPSYRRNRDYTNDFNWTYELKTDVYRCYVEARNDKNIGYIWMFIERKLFAQSGLLMNATYIVFR